MPGFDMKDYVPVNERVEQFYRTYPEGSIQSEIVELTDKRVTIKAFAYRTPTDPRPGIGHSSLDIPGATPYTRGSEIENAETSSWGRAIAALGFEVKRGMASAEEVRNKNGQRPAPKPAGPSDEQIRARYAWAKALGWSDAALDDAMAARTGATPMDATDAAWKAFARQLRDGEIQHDQPALTADAVGAADPVSVPAGQPTGRQEERDSLPPLPAEPTLDDVLSATGGSLEQPDGDPPAAPVSPGEPALAPVGSANAGSSGATRDAREAAAKARARAGR